MLQLNPFFSHLNRSMWNLCIICQTATSELLRSPLHAPNFTIDVYKTFLYNVNGFKNLNALPVELDLADCTADDLVTNQAKWHQSCHLKFSSSRLIRAQDKAKRSISDQDEDLYTRPAKRQSTRANVEKNCIFCDESERDGYGALHSFSTLEADENVRSIATELKKFDLLAKISHGDLIAIEAKYHNKCSTALKKISIGLCNARIKVLS